MSPRFALTYPLRALRRDGQRSLLAIVCIAFGVLSLVSMQLLASMLGDAFLVQPRLAEGGDAILTPTRPMHLAALQSELAGLEDQGLISSWTLTVPTSNILIRTENSGRVHFLTRAQAVDAASFPLLGELPLFAPEGDEAKAVLSVPGHCLITRDLADQLSLSVGDIVLLSGGDGGQPVRLEVGGIAAMVPDRRGMSLFMSLATAQASGDPLFGLRAPVLWGEQGPSGPTLEAQGWRVRIPPDTPDTAGADLFTFAFSGAGILGLLIGGIGVANTMQVILARRTQEVATLKTIGYRQRNLLVLFGLETLLMGLIGSMLGIVLALLLAGEFLRLLNPSMPFLLAYRIDLWVVLGGLGVGMATAVIFGLAAIIKASAVRPAVLLRDLPVARSWRNRTARVALYGVLFVLFALLCSLILSSWLRGLGVIALGIGGIIVLGAIVGGLLFVAVRIPTPGLFLVGMARSNLRHQPLRAVYALVALSVGVFSIGFAAVSLSSARQQATARSLGSGGYNLMAMSTAEQIAAITTPLDAAGITTYRTGWTTRVQSGTNDGKVFSTISSVEGRAPGDLDWNLTLSSGTWPTTASEVAIPAWQFRQTGLALGDTLQLTTLSTTEAVVLTGSFAPNPDVDAVLARARGLIGLDTLARRLGGPHLAVRLHAAVPAEALATTADALGAGGSEVAVLTKLDLDGFLNRTFRGLFLFVVAVAALSLVAGAVLIANAVGLAMVERRRALGILKAVGYTRQQVLFTIVIENALLGALGGLVGLLLVQGMIAYTNANFDEAGLALSLGIALPLVAVSMLLAVGSALLVAWHPTQRRPLEVLRYE